MIGFILGNAVFTIIIFYLIREQLVSPDNMIIRIVPMILFMILITCAESVIGYVIAKLLKFGFGIFKIPIPKYTPNFINNGWGGISLILLLSIILWLYDMIKLLFIEETIIIQDFIQWVILTGQVIMFLFLIFIGFKQFSKQFSLT